MLKKRGGEVNSFLNNVKKNCNIGWGGLPLTSFYCPYLKAEMCSASLMANYRSIQAPKNLLHTQTKGVALT